jgi:hypothetical protein
MRFWGVLQEVRKRCREQLQGALCRLITTGNLRDTNSINILGCNKKEEAVRGVRVAVEFIKNYRRLAGKIRQCD